MVVTVLRGPLARSGMVAEQGLKVIANLANRDENNRLLGAVGACKGE